MSPAAKVAAALTRYGRAMTLQRRTGTATFTSVTVYGVTQNFDPDKIQGAVRQGDIRVVISNAEIAAASWPAPPRSGDFIVIDSKSWAVQGCDAKLLGSDVLAYELWVRGGV
jgi:hypothetical protein